MMISQWLKRMKILRAKVELFALEVCVPPLINNFILPQEITATYNRRIFELKETIYQQ